MPGKPPETTSLPETPEISDEAIAVATEYLAELEVPKRVKFTPSQLAADVGGSRSTWQRECKLGNIEAVRLPGGWVVSWYRLVRYFARRQNVVSKN